jgi:hypothetical protein
MGDKRAQELAGRAVMFQNLPEFVGSGILIRNKQITLRIKDKAPGPLYRTIPFLNEFAQKRTSACVEALHRIVILITDIHRVGMARGGDAEPYYSISRIDSHFKKG